jgi:hypothetical protein
MRKDYRLPCEVCGGTDAIQTSARPLEEGGHAIITKHQSGKECDWRDRPQEVDSPREQRRSTTRPLRQDD